MEQSELKQIPFGFNFKWNSNYFYSELEMFEECSEGIEPEELRQRYLTFLDNIQLIKASTLVDVDVYHIFLCDCDNRAQIDYREGHYEDEPTIKRGGKAFHNRFLKMKT